jgi:hypothetical protein
VIGGTVGFPGTTGLGVGVGVAAGAQAARMDPTRANATTRYNVLRIETLLLLFVFNNIV